MLVLLLGWISWFVTRQVVDPVRYAASIAEEFSAGHLSERMTVKGEDDLARLASSFNEMAASLEVKIGQLEDLSRVQRRFVSDVSHELRTPLTTVRMAADVLHESRGGLRPGDGPVGRAAADPARPVRGAPCRPPGDLPLRCRCRHPRRRRGRPAGRRHLGRRGAGPAGRAQPLRDPTPTRLPSLPSAEYDPRRVDRILRNLLANAIEHGEGRPIDISVACSDDAVAIVVRDHGAGLRPGESSLVFNRFWRADPSRVRSIGGTGLGLPIALEDARLHGGWLQAWGSPGDGASFRLTLPRHLGVGDHVVPTSPGAR